MKRTASFRTLSSVFCLMSSVFCLSSPRAVPPPTQPTRASRNEGVFPLKAIDPAKTVHITV